MNNLQKGINLYNLGFPIGIESELQFAVDKFGVYSMFDNKIINDLRVAMGFEVGALSKKNMFL